MDIDVVDLLKGGVDRFDLSDLGQEEVGKKVGATSAFYRDLPYGQASSDEEGKETFRTRLRSGHLYQEDIARVLDVRLAYAISPTPVIHEAMVAIHNPGYFRRRNALLDETDGEFRLAGGVVQLPDLYTLGVEGGSFVSFRADAAVDFSDELGNGFGGAFQFGIQYNDAEQLALYPFARNALSYSIQFRGGFE